MSASLGFFIKILGRINYLLKNELLPPIAHSWAVKIVC